MVLWNLQTCGWFFPGRPVSFGKSSVGVVLSFPSSPGTRPDFFFSLGGAGQEGRGDTSRANFLLGWGFVSTRPRRYMNMAFVSAWQVLPADFSLSFVGVTEVALPGAFLLWFSLFGRSIFLLSDFWWPFSSISRHYRLILWSLPEES